MNDILQHIGTHLLRRSPVAAVAAVVAYLLSFAVNEPCHPSAMRVLVEVGLDRECLNVLGMNPFGMVGGNHLLPAAVAAVAAASIVAFVRYFIGGVRATISMWKAPSGGAQPPD